MKKTVAEKMSEHGKRDIGLSADWVNSAYLLAGGFDCSYQLVAFEEDHGTYSILYREDLPDDIAYALGSEGSIVELVANIRSDKIMRFIGESLINAYVESGRAMIAERVKTCAI